MKTFLSLVAAMFFSVLCMAQPSNITGVTTAVEINKVSLYKVLNGRLIEVATSIPDKEGRFGFRFTPEYKGFYCVGFGPAHFSQYMHKYYFRGNENIEISLSIDECKLINSNSPEINAYEKWNLAIAEIAQKSMSLGGLSTFVDFYPQIEEFKNNLVTFKKNPKTGNKEFDAMFPTYVDFDFAFYALNYNYMPHQAHPSEEEMSDYYVQYNPDLYFSEVLLQLPYGDRFLGNLVMKKNAGKRSFTTEQLIQSIPVDVLKGQFALNYLERSKSLDNFNALKETFASVFTLDEQKERLLKMEASLSESKSGVPAFKFSFPDKDGKEVALTDLKGKVVFVDLWATWCGPCRAEEPHWEKLNEEYKGKPVAFVGISVDQKKDEWLKYVQEKTLKGIQLHAGGNNPLSAAYKVTGIPRYILIDKAGNLISADSPRPSDPKLKELLNTWIQK